MYRNWSGIHYVAEGDLELLLPPPPFLWDYRCPSTCPVYVVLESEPRASSMLGRHSN